MVPELQFDSLDFRVDSRVMTTKPTKQHLVSCRSSYVICCIKTYHQSEYVSGMKMNDTLYT